MASRPVDWRVGIKAALGTAGAIRDIATANLRDHAALVRFLVAVVDWCQERLLLK